MRFRSNNFLQHRNIQAKPNSVMALSSSRTIECVGEQRLVRQTAIKWKGSTEWTWIDDSDYLAMLNSSIQSPGLADNLQGISQINHHEMEHTTELSSSQLVTTKISPAKVPKKKKTLERRPTRASTLLPKARDTTPEDEGEEEIPPPRARPSPALPRSVSSSPKSSSSSAVTQSPVAEAPVKKTKAVKPKPGKAIVTPTSASDAASGRYPRREKIQQPPLVKKKAVSLATANLKSKIQALQVVENEKLTKLMQQAKKTSSSAASSSSPDSGCGSASSSPQVSPAGPAPEPKARSKKFELEKILGCTRKGQSLSYLIKWHGLSAAYNSWEDGDTMTGAEEAVKAFTKEFGTVSSAQPSILSPEGLAWKLGLQ